MLLLKVTISWVTRLLTIIFGLVSLDWVVIFLFIPQVFSSTETLRMPLHQWQPLMFLLRRRPLMYMNELLTLVLDSLFERKWKLIVVRGNGWLPFVHERFLLLLVTWGRVWEVGVRVDDNLCIANYAMPYLSDAIALILARDRDKSSGIYLFIYVLLFVFLCFLFYVYLTDKFL